jgi:hypothetical protein
MPPAWTEPASAVLASAGSASAAPNASSVLRPSRDCGTIYLSEIACGTQASAARALSVRTAHTHRETMRECELQNARAHTETLRACEFLNILERMCVCVDIQKELSDTKEKDAKIIDDKGREIAAAPPEERNAVAAVAWSEAIDARSLTAEAGGCYERKRWKVVNYNEKQRSDGSLAMTLRLKRKRAASSEREVENVQLKKRLAVLEEEHRCLFSPNPYEMKTNQRMIFYTNASVTVREVMVERHTAHTIAAETHRTGS